MDPKSIDHGKAIGVSGEMNVDPNEMGYTGFNVAGWTAHNTELPRAPSKQKGAHSPPPPPPEGRVHGGSLMALLSGGFNSLVGEPSMPMEYQVAQQRWL